MSGAGCSRPRSRRSDASRSTSRCSKSARGRSSANGAGPSGGRAAATPVVGRGVRSWVQAGAEQRRWTVGIPSRRCLLLLSLLGASALLWVLVQIGLGAERWWMRSRFVAKGLDAFWERGRLRQIGLAGGLLLLAVIIKRGFVDYIADIALYTTA